MKIEVWTPRKDSRHPWCDLVIPNGYGFSISAKSLCRLREQELFCCCLTENQLQTLLANLGSLTNTGAPTDLLEKTQSVTRKCRIGIFFAVWKNFQWPPTRENSRSFFLEEQGMWKGLRSGFQSTKKKSGDSNFEFVRAVDSISDLCERADLITGIIYNR